MTSRSPVASCRSSPTSSRPSSSSADDLAELGALSLRPEANIIKLPNISASMPQLKAAIAELQSQGYALPDYPDDPADDAERDIRTRYDKVKGSAVNPVLREGNSDRRAPRAVKEYAKSHPHSMGAWSADSKTHVATMGHDDFYSNEQSVTVPEADDLRIELVGTDGAVTVLKPSVKVLAGEVVDGTFMSKQALVDFYAEQIADAKAKGVLFSLHLKATMMKVSDPILFGHAVRVFFADVFAKHGDVLDAAGADPNNGWGGVLDVIAGLPEAQRTAIEADIAAVWANAPEIAMVDSDRGITNLHVPSDIIVDASMPAMIRQSGQMWDKDGKTQDCKAVIPDACYAGIYQAVIDDCKAHGAYDPRTMGSVPNVGLMAQAAEEYGSHDKTFEMPADGTVRVVNQAGEALMEFHVARGRRLAHVQRPRPADPGLGEAGRHPRPRHRRTGGVLARRRPRPRRAADREGPPLPAGPRHPRPRHPHPVAGRTPRCSRSSASARVSTRSRSPATCCATTTPTCSRSSSSAPAPRCSRSCR